MRSSIVGLGLLDTASVLRENRFPGMETIDSDEVVVVEEGRRGGRVRASAISKWESI